MEADLTLEELNSTIKRKAMKDMAPGPDGIPYSVYSKLWEQAGPLILNSWNYSNEKNELSREQQLFLTVVLLRVLRFLPSIPLLGDGMPP